MFGDSSKSQAGARAVRSAKFILYNHFSPTSNTENIQANSEQSALAEIEREAFVLSGLLTDFVQKLCSFFRWRWDF